LLDFFKVPYYSTILKEYFHRHPLLNFDVDENNHKTNCIKYFANYQGLKFETCTYEGQMESLVTISGSLHRFYNNGEDNSNDFDISALIKTAYKFCKEFQIPPNIVKLQSLEFGLNIDLGYPPDGDFFDSLIVLHADGGSRRPSKIDSKDLKGWEFGRYFTISGQYHLKLYSKGKKSNILRVEIRLIKTQKLRKLYSLKEYDLLTFLDFLNPNALFNIVNDLVIGSFNKILIDEHIDEDCNVCDDDYKFYLKYSNDKNWDKLSKENKRQAKIKFDSLLNRFGKYHIKEQVSRLLKEKLDECMVLDSEAHECLKMLQTGEFLEIYRNDFKAFPPDYHSVESNLVEVNDINNYSDKSFFEIIKLLDEIYEDEMFHYEGSLSLEKVKNYITGFTDKLCLIKAKLKLSFIS